MVIIMQDINLKYVNEKYDANGVLTEYSLNIPEHFNFGFDIVDEMARLEPQKTAMVWCNQKGEEHIFNFADIKRSSNKTANFLKKAGIKKGDIVMLVLKRHYEFWFSMVALHKIGAIAIPATAMLTAKDLEYRFNFTGVKAIICTADGEVSDYVDEAQKKSPTLELKIIARGKKDGWLSFDDEFEAAGDEFQRPAGDEENLSTDPMVMFFSSGTSGMPKLACHDYIYALAHIFTAKHWQNVDPNGLHLTVAETGWGKALWGKLYGQWIMEAAVFVYDFDKFEPNDLLTKIEKYKVTTFCAPPTIYRFLIKEDLGKYNLSSLKYATTAGEALNAAVFTKFYELTGLKIMECYGQTETTVTLVNLVGTEPKPGTLGKPSPHYVLDLFNEDGKHVNTGEVGEIVIKTGNKRQPGLFKGYYNDQELTDATWYDGYYHTGDTAWRDEEGYYWYVGRTDDVIKASGYRIGPFEVESVLMKHPAVLECAVTGFPDPIRGQIVKATIVLTKKYKPTEELANELKEFVKHQTAPYKYPRKIEFVTELPKTISGKIRRVDIRKRDEKQNI
jgi:acetyl-CoA synthetase